MKTMIRNLTRQAGYSAVELMLVVGIMSVVGSVGAVQMQIAVPASKGNSAMRSVVAQLNTARELAITQRRNMHIYFQNSREIKTERQNADNPATVTVLSTIPLEGGVQFNMIAGVADTPDAFGKAQAIDFGGALGLQFSSDGTLIDANGRLVNGTVFLSIPNSPRSFRAVTVLGSTGRVRGFRWNGTRWEQ